MREAGLESYGRRLPLGRDLLTEIRLGSTSRDPGELFGFFKLQQGSGSGVCNSSVPTSLEYNKHYLYCTVCRASSEDAVDMLLDGPEGGGQPALSGTERGALARGSEAGP